MRQKVIDTTVSLCGVRHCKSVFFPVGLYRCLSFLTRYAYEKAIGIPLLTLIIIILHDRQFAPTISAAGTEKYNDTLAAFQHFRADRRPVIKSNFKIRQSVARLQRPHRLDFIIDTPRAVTIISNIDSISIIRFIYS